MWIGLGLAAVLTATIVGVVDWFVMWSQSSTCHDVPDPDEVRSGQISLGVVLLVSAAPWVLGGVMSRRRTAVAVTGGLAVLPGLLLFLNGLRTDAWVGGFCF